ncbi:MAG: sel1 repeat family protein, partial [Kiritimatiellae bacterium]|nr:sel1 repeat family protein [Kiritimatiellia bacterium]
MKRLLAAFAVLTAGLCPGQETNSAALVEEADRLCLYAPVDFARADELLRRAEAAGSADAIAIRGFMARNGEGVPYDPARARELFREAAARGSVRGRIQHAADRLGGPDAEAALRELASIADSDDPYAWLACDQLAKHYERRAARSAAAPVNGADEALAGLYYSKALAKLAPRAEAGDPEARVAYGDLILFPRTSGDIWEPDAAWAQAENARQWLLPEAEKGNLSALSMAVESFDTNFFPRPSFLPDDPAAAASNAAARVRLRDRLVAGLQQAVDQGGVDQAVWLADKLLGGLLDGYGETADTDPVRAAALLRTAADAGHPYAAFLLARCHERGVGVPRAAAAAQAR